MAATLDPVIVTKIDLSLSEISRARRVAIPLAIESGSRAWGFPSIDSDYDCRFFFVRARSDYLSLWPGRDVIELPVDPVFDVNGWDIAKALRLLIAGNAVAIEWLTSPIAYRVDEDFRRDFLALAARVADRNRIAAHYLHLGLRQQRTYLADEKQVRLKKLFYALRPAAALRWLRFHPGASVAPMHFPTLMAQCAPPGDVTDITADLIARKAAAKELGLGELPAPIKRFIDEEFALAPTAFPVDQNAPAADNRAEADAFFRRMVERFDPGRA